MKGIKVIVIGGDGRACALWKKISESPRVSEVLCAPGNGGIPSEFRRKVGANSVIDIAALAFDEHADLVVVGPEGPLEQGVIDHLSGCRIRAFGPTKVAAMLETDKAFTQEFCKSNGIPIAEGWVAKNFDDALSTIRREWERGPLVVKAFGTFAGKGVVLPKSADEAVGVSYAAFNEGRFGIAGRTLVLQRKLWGRELSYIVITDGRSFKRLLSARDFKRAYEGDLGPNTGGMGSYAPCPDVSDEVLDEIDHTIIAPTLSAMARVGKPFRGALYAGIMLTSKGPQLFEYNCRFGDPETQVLLALMQSDIVPYLWAATETGGLEALPPIAFEPGAAFAITLAADGYPGTPLTGHPIKIRNNPSLIHAGTDIVDGRLVVTEGRALYGIGKGKNHATARRYAYDAAANVDSHGLWCRKDIGNEFV